MNRAMGRGSGEDSCLVFAHTIYKRESIINKERRFGYEKNNNRKKKREEKKYGTNVCFMLQIGL